MLMLRFLGGWFYALFTGGVNARGVIAIEAIKPDSQGLQ